MNLILLENSNERQILPKNDPRSIHIEQYLLKEPQDTFYVGCIDQSLGKANVVRLANGDLSLQIEWGMPNQTEPLLPITLMVGLCRPQTCRKILRELAPLGIREAHFVQCSKSEPSYLQSKLWASGEWERQLSEGIEQSFGVQKPIVSCGKLLEDALSENQLKADVSYLCLDNYEGESELIEAATDLQQSTVIAIGPEGGWTAAERTLFRDNGYRVVHMGNRVLRTETAVIAASSLLGANYRFRSHPFDV